MDVLDDGTDVIAAVDAVATIIHGMREPVDAAYWARRLSQDGRFAAEMALCKDWGISHSAFKAWSAEDREKALGYQLYESRRCHECGMHPDDWPEDGSFEEAPPFVVEASRCYGCLAMHDFTTDWRKANTHQGQVDERAMKGVRSRFVRTGG